MTVSLLYPAAVKGLHVKASVSHVNGHTHKSAQRKIGAGGVYKDASACDDITVRKDGVVELELYGIAALDESNNERFRLVFIVIGIRQALHGQAAGDCLVAVVEEVAGKAAIGHFELYRCLAIVSPADARPLKAQVIQAVIVVRRVVHDAAAKLDIVLDGKGLCIPIEHSLAEVDVL